MKWNVSGPSVSRPRSVTVLASNSEYRRCIATASIIHKPISERTITPAAIILSVGEGGFESPLDPIPRLQGIQPKNRPKNGACGGRGKHTAWRHKSEDTNSLSAPSQGSTVSLRISDSTPSIIMVHHREVRAKAVGVAEG
jgi:hypothetical protein